MRITFYAPLKAPMAPNPSGDRLIGRLLMAALQTAGHRVNLASRFRSYDGGGGDARQARIRDVGERLAHRVLRRYAGRPAGERPELWFTYHLYHKAPDWIGPVVAPALGVPYVVAEASLAPRQQNGPWRIGHDSVERALAAADLVIGLNRADEPCVRPVLASPERYATLEPFIDRRPFGQAAEKRETARRVLSARFGLVETVPWLLCVAMMRAGDKLQSYQLLAEALSRLADRPWHLLVAGDGEAADEVRRAFAALDHRVTWLGRQDAAVLTETYAAGDLFVWPAVKESPGMCFLEAGAAGLAVVGSNAGGVPDVVGHGETGLLPPHLDVDGFAGCVARLLDDADLRHRLGRAAAERVTRRHDVVSAGARLDGLLRGGVP